jgi:outer membrane protein TolC
MKKIILLTGILSLLFVQMPSLAQEILSLERCKELALKNNTKLQNAQLSVETAIQSKKEAFTNYFPAVSIAGMGFLSNKPMLSTEMDISSMMSPIIEQLAPLMQLLTQFGIQAPSLNMESVKIEAMKNGIIGGVIATQPLFAGGQIVNGNRLAKTGVEIYKLQQQMTENEVLLATEIYYWQLISLQEKIKTIADAEAMLNRIHSDVSISVEAGVIIKNDLLRVELEQNRLAGNLLKLENGIQILKMLFGQHIGISADSFDIEKPTFEEIVLPSLQTDNHSVLQNRPEYQLLQRSVDVAKLQMKMEVGKNLPTIAIGAGYNYMNFDLNKSDGIKNNFGMLFANVSIPLTDWWSASHAVKRKKIELKITENTQKENTNMLLLQMQQLVAELNETYKQVLIAEKLIATAEENLKISEDSYKAGVVILSDLLDAQNLLQQARNQYAETLIQYYIKLAEYKKVTEASN